MEALLEGIWVSCISLIFGQNIPYPVNFFGLYPNDASYDDDVIQCDMFGYLVTKNTFSWGVSSLFRWFVPSAVRYRTALLLLCFSRIVCMHASGISIPPSLLMFFRVRSYVNCLFDPKCVVMRITINKLNFVPEWQMSVLWSCSETAESGYGLVGFLDHAQSCMGPVSPM